MASPISSTMARSRCWITETVIGSMAGSMLGLILRTEQAAVAGNARGKARMPAHPRLGQLAAAGFILARSRRRQEGGAQGTELVDRQRQAFALGGGDRQAHRNHAAPGHVDAGGKQVEKVELAQGLLPCTEAIGPLDRPLPKMRLHHAAQTAEVHVDGTLSADVVEPRA